MVSVWQIQRFKEELDDANIVRPPRTRGILKLLKPKWEAFGSLEEYHGMLIREGQ
jgi:hypothetical protein